MSKGRRPWGGPGARGPTASEQRCSPPYRVYLWVWVAWLSFFSLLYVRFAQDGLEPLVLLPPPPVLGLQAYAIVHSSWGSGD